MRVLVIAAAGCIGSRLIQKFINMPVDNIEYMVAIDNPDISPLFNDTPYRKWLKKELELMSPEDWRDIIQNYNITRIYYVDSRENSNEFIPTSTSNLRYKKTNNSFLEYISTLYISGITPLELVYISSDELYRNDAFPDENHPIVFNPVTVETTQDIKLLEEYALIKFEAEIKLNSIENLNLRIIRPFGIVAPENGDDFPFCYTINKVIRNQDLDIFMEGSQGLTFTHINDLTETITSSRLFDPTIGGELTSTIINFARVQNYISQYLLLDKMRKKMESSSVLIPSTYNNYFKDIMKPPQIRNLFKIHIPKITLDEIIEEFIVVREPSITHDPLIVEHVGYINGPRLKISGLAEPGSSIVVYLDTGETLNADVEGNGTWSVKTDETYVVDEDLQAEVRNISLDGVHFDTEIINIPSSINYTPEVEVDLEINSIGYEYTLGGNPQPYLVISGVFEPGGSISISIPRPLGNDGIIYIETTISENNNWEIKTLPGYYITEEGLKGTLKAYHEDGSPYTTMEFELPVTPTAPAQQQTTINEYSPVKIEEIHYRIDPNDSKQYLEIKGKAEPESRIIVSIPGSSGSISGILRLEGSSNSQGHWYVRTGTPYYMIEDNQKVKAHAYLINGDIYSMSEDILPISPEIPPAPPEEHPFIITKIDYTFDYQQRPYLKIQGEARNNTKVKIMIDSINLETTPSNNIWEITTTEPFYNTLFDKYGAAGLYDNDGTIIDYIEFKIAPTPTKPQPIIPTNELIVNRVEYKQTEWMEQDTNYLYISGVSKALGSIVAKIPSQDDASLDEYRTMVDEDGLWEIKTKENYNPGTELLGEIDGYDNTNIKFDSVTFVIPKAPTLEP
jgi:nucleoside-diphosphate-sugar epimerase